MCKINLDGPLQVDFKLLPLEYENYRQSLIQKCGLDVSNVPTLSQWGPIASAGVFGIFGLYAIKSSIIRQKIK